jgi:hypothetical protein
MAPPDDLAAQLAGMPEEERTALMQQLTGMGGLDGRSELVKEQLAQSEALANSLQGRNYGGGVGGVIGMFAKGVRGLMGRLDRDRLQGEQKALIDEGTKGRAAGMKLAGEQQPFDLSGYLGAEDDATAQQHSAALAQALSGQRKTATALQASGDKVLGGLGANMMADVGRREAQLADAGKGRLRDALDRQKLKESTAEFSEANAPSGETYAQLAKKFGVSLPAGTTNRQAKEFLILAELAYAAEQRAQEMSLNRSAMRGERELRTTERQQKTLDDQTKELAEDVDKFGAPAFYQKQAEASDIISKSGDDLPGQGPIAGRLPDWMISAEGVALRQATGQMLAEYRKGITGAGMSNTERDEFGRITGLLESGDPKAYKQGVARLQRAMDARVSARAAGTPGAADAYSKRQPWMKQALERSNGGGAPVPAMTPQDAAAMDWAKQNPNDPRAAAILKRLGGGQ